MTMEIVRYEEQGTLGIITLNNPPVNAFSWEVSAQLSEILVRISKSEVRAVLTRADGKNFCAGADVNIFVDQTYRTGSSLLSEAFSLIHRLETLHVPTVVAVQGLCLAAGMELMLAHDIIFAGASAQIGQSESMIGATTFAGGAQRICERAGSARAKQMVFEAKFYDAATLERWNIVNYVVPDEELDAKALAYARRLANGPTAALSVSKATINACAGSGLLAADRLLQASAHHLFETDDMRTGVKAFLELGAHAFRANGPSFLGK
jgi:enoyl-CoA hydratase/carnithine racemase